MKNEVKINSQLHQYFLALAERIPERDAEVAEKGKAAFLAEARQINPAVSPRNSQRWSFWFLRDRPRLAMTVLSLAVAICLAFGAVGGTVYAAQDSLPDEPLYGVKILGEEIRLRMAIRREKRIALHALYASQRVNEIVQVRKQGNPVSPEIISNLDKHAHAMLGESADFDDTDMINSLMGIKETLNFQKQTVVKLLEEIPSGEDEILLKVQEKLQSKIEQADQGIRDPEEFRTKYQSKQKDKEGQQKGKNKNTEDTGKPADAEKPDDVGKPENPGKPTDKGTPEDKGKPEDRGKPDDKGKPQEKKIPGGGPPVDLPGRE